MSQFFHPSFNAVSKISVIFALIFVGVASTTWGLMLRSSFVTGVGEPIEQEVPFSHKHHVQGMGLDCRFCHATVEESPFAGMPSTQTCMTCHSRIWTEAQMLEPVRESYRETKALKWNRVHDLPDFAYFDHSIHVAKGIGCSTCHGRVDQMPLVWKENTLHMEWCLDCHRAPERHVRPRDEVFNMEWEPPANQDEAGLKLVKSYGIERGNGKLTNCSICHR